MGPDATILVFGVLSFKPAFSLSLSPSLRGSLGLCSVPLWPEAFSSEGSTHFCEFVCHTSSTPMNILGGFPGGSVVKNLCAVQETQVQSLIQEDSPGKGNGTPLQYSCLRNPMNRGVWWATGVAKSQTRLSNWTTTILIYVISFHLILTIRYCEY